METDDASPDASSNCEEPVKSIVLQRADTSMGAANTRTLFKASIICFTSKPLVLQQRFFLSLGNQMGC
jgi:hypothetical protein